MYKEEARETGESIAKAEIQGISKSLKSPKAFDLRQGSDAENQRTCDPEDNNLANPKWE